MKLKCIILLVIPFAMCCGQKKDVKLNLITQEIHYATIFETPKDSSNQEIIKNVYWRYRNNTEWQQSLNLIEFEITNNTDSKIFILKTPIMLEEAYEVSNELSSNTYYQIMTDNEETLLPIPPDMHSSLPRTSQPEVKEQYRKDSIAQKNTIYDSYEIEKRIGEFAVLNPNKSMVVASKLSLPIPINFENPLDIGFCKPMFSPKKYNFRLHYVVNKVDIEENLPKVILDSLRKEKVVIRDILLSSKIIKVLPK
jgi:hypothetical protein